MLIILYWSLPWILFLVGVFVFLLNRSHLLSIPTYKINIYCINYIFLLLIFVNLMDFSTFFSNIFLNFSVFEGAFGLSFLVLIIRTHGNDYFQSFNILQCNNWFI